MHRLQARPAEPVERGRADLDGPARGEYGIAGQVCALFACLRNAPGDHVVHPRRVEPVASPERHEELREQFLWMDPRERTLALLPSSARSAHRIDHVAGGHDRSPLPPRAAAAPSARQARSTSSDRSVPLTARARLSPPYINAMSPMASRRRGTMPSAGRRCARPSRRACTSAATIVRCCGAVVPTSLTTAGIGHPGGSDTFETTDEHR